MMSSVNSLIALNKTLGMMLNSTKNERPRLAPDLTGKAFSLSTGDVILAVGFLRMLFIGFRKFPSIFSLLRVFIMNGCGI